MDNLAYQWNSHSLKFGTNLRFGREIDARGSIAGYNAATDVYFNGDLDNTEFSQESDVPGTPNLSESSENFALYQVFTD